MACSVQPNSLTGRATTMNKYLVKLTPLGKYFFGGDMTFKSGRKKDNDDEKYGSYIIHSFKTPQQTSLLGMMRFLLLSNDGNAFDVENNRIKNKDKADTLIGEKSFCVSEGHKANNFGKISSIGPCFLYDKKAAKAYFRILLPDWQIAFADAPVKAVINGAEVELPKIWVEKDGKEEAYTGKDGMDVCYASLDKSPVLKKEEDLFTEDSRIGIAKNEKGKSDSSAFYKQISYRLEKGFCFAFEVETEVDLTKYQNRLVQLGADSSSFLLEVEQNTVGYPQSKNDLQVVLVSDAYIESTEGLKIRFAVTRVRPFRFLHTGNSKNPQNYNTRYNSIRQKRYDLYEAGSVFYFKDKESRDKFCEYLDSFKEFTQIGYNQFAK